MVVFNQTDYSNLTNVTQIFEVAETFSGEYLGFAIWIMISMGSFFMLSGYKVKDGLIASSLIALISALFLAYLGMLDGLFVMVSLSLFVISLVLAIVIKGQSGA